MDTKIFKQQLLNKLYNAYNNCTACPLGTLGRTSIVFGEGNPDAKIMLIGEAPGRDEDIQGRPFVGRSGQLLSKTLAAVGLERADLFITNIVKCRPPNNRTPLPPESSTCKQCLLVSQIQIIRPRLICTLGACASMALLPPEKAAPFKITQSHGNPLEINSPIKINLMPMFHPAYILRNPQKLEMFVIDFVLAKKFLSELK